MISLRTWLGLYLQIYADPNPSTTLPPVCTLPPRPPPALTCVTATASNLFSRLRSPAHIILFKPSSRGYSAKSQIMSWLCSKPSNLWSPRASHFQSLQWPMTSPTWLGSHTLIPFTPRHWPHSSHNGLLVVHHPHQPGSHPLARTHPGNPVAQPGTSFWWSSPHQWGLPWSLPTLHAPSSVAVFAPCHLSLPPTLYIHWLICLWSICTRI